MIGKLMLANLIIVLLSLHRMGSAVRKGDVQGMILYQGSLRIAALSGFILLILSMLYGAFGL